MGITHQCVLYDVLWIRNWINAQIPALTPLRVCLCGYQQQDNTRRDRQLPMLPQQNQHLLPKGERNPACDMAPTILVSKYSPTSIANLCSTDHNEECRGNTGYSKECIKEMTRHSCTGDENQRQEPLLDVPSDRARRKRTSHKLSESGWDSTFRCVKAVQSVLFSF